MNHDVKLHTKASQFAVAVLSFSITAAMLGSFESAARRTAADHTTASAASQQVEKIEVVATRIVMPSHRT